MNSKPSQVQTNTPENTEKTLKTILTLLVVCIVLSITGLGFGIYGTIQANRALNESGISDEEGELDENDLEEYTYGKPSDPSSIDYIAISYNGNNDYIDIDKEGTIDYYTYDSNDEYVGNATETNTTDIITYVFDNNLQYLGDNEMGEDETWSVEISSEDGDSYIGGSDPAPEWFTELLKKLEVDSKGYQSKKL